MLTGQYQQRFGRMFDGPLSEILHRDTGLPHDATTIAELLKENGYATACFGKWHLGHQPPWLPPHYGFDEFRGLGSGDGDHHSHIDRSGNEDWWHNNQIEMEEGYTADLLTKHSIDFIEKNHDRPFFLYVPHLAIHFPWQGPNDPPHRVQGTDYAEDKWGIIPEPRNVSTHVKSMVESIDRSTGKIIETLKKLKLDNSTIVVFTSDNGGYLTYGKRFANISSNGVLRGQKGTLYEGGHRVPMIVSWPGSIPPALTEETAHSTDLLPTLAAVADAKSDHLQLDGMDLTSLLIKGERLPERMLFWRADDESAVRSGPWKLRIQGEQHELFRLDSDVEETKNLFDQNPDIAKHLADAWKKWEADANESAQKAKRRRAIATQK
jgi:arylsulfatase A-like enzyme